MLQVHVDRPEQLDASVMANPDCASTAEVEIPGGQKHEMDVHGGQKFSVTAEPAKFHSSPTSFHPHVRHTFPFSMIANPPPMTDFAQPHSYCPPAATGNPRSVYDGGFNPSRFGQQFDDRNVLLTTNVYQATSDAAHPTASAFDLMHVMPSSVSAGCQPVSCSLASSKTFVSQSAFSIPFQSANSTSSQPWLPDAHLPAFPPLPRFQMPQAEMLDEFCGSLFQGSTVGSDSMSSGSPITELFDRASSPPPQLPPGPGYGISNLVDHVTVSPFCQSPIDSLQLSRSLPAGVRFGGSQAGLSDVAVGRPRASSRVVHYDNMSPLSHRSLVQPGNVHGRLDVSAASPFQVQTICSRCLVVRT